MPKGTEQGVEEFKKGVGSTLADCIRKMEIVFWLMKRKIPRNVKP